MVSVIDSSTGEIVEQESIAEAAAEMIERPPYWRKTAHGQEVEEGEWGIEFDQAFLKAQIEIGPLVETDATNSFQKNKYSSLGGWLAKVQPILNRHGFLINQGAGRINSRADGKQLFLPVWFKMTHVATGEWKRVFIEEPLGKVDPQGVAIALTYGRRQAGSAFVSTKDADPDGVLLQSLADHDQLTAAMLEKIAACKTPLELRSWAKASQQQVESLNEEHAEKLRVAWQERLNALKEKVAPAKKAEAKDAA